MVAARCARRLKIVMGVIERALLSGLCLQAFLLLASMVVRGLGPNLQGELSSSGCPTGSPNPDFSIICPYGSSPSHTY